MIRYRYIYLIMLIGVSSVTSVISEEQNPISKKTIIDLYLKNAAQIREMKGSVQFGFQRLFFGEITNSLKAEIEKVFGLPQHDPVYDRNPVPILKCFDRMSWDAVLDGTKMTGTQRYLNTNTKLLDRPKNIRSLDGTMILHLDPLPNLEFPFELHSSSSSNKNSALQLFLPMPIAHWHYLPSVWYPDAERMGLPSDLSKITLHWRGADPTVIVFNPVSLPAGTLDYFRYLTDNPKLSLDDLTAILTLDSTTYLCQSFSINMQEGGKQRQLFNITNSGFDDDLYTVPIPRMSIVFTSWIYQKDGETTWSCNNFSQINIDNFAGL